MTRAISALLTATLLTACRPEPVGVSTIDLAIRAPSASKRVLLRPSELAFVSSRGPLDASGLPHLGREADGTTALLLRFELAFREAEEVRGAFVLLETSPDARRPSSSILVDVSRVLEPWSAAGTHWATLPRLDVVAARAFSPRAPGVMRIDVTDLVREWPRRRADEHGIALVASAQDPYGLTLLLGGAAGEGPRLEVYLQ